ncbi:Nramp family divalent metal transporter [Botrimarina sp.]|uniref:Nramp family divalent metal transporter n=1 Tax=Botrimarina sp. TaxID=2795802 RepID=UPI0032EEF668
MSNPTQTPAPAPLEPPTSWREAIPYLGPGFVLSAAIVGSGELIATTALGAEAGFTALWVILLSCVIKVALQLQFGRHAILTGETVMESFNKIPGPAAAGVSWPIWLWLAAQPLKVLQVGGIIGSLALLMNMVLPSLPVWIWCWGFAILVAVLVATNRYTTIERVALSLLGGFTALTLASVVSLQWTEYAISAADILSGLTFQLPAHTLLVVFGAFGLTGVGGDEVMQYPYWMLEKGYAAHAGARAADDPDWRRRARGWIRVMYADALLSMAAYTLVTAAFYLLGAAVLHAQGLTPEGTGVIRTLAEMYTNSLGAWAEGVFLFGAFTVLFSTLFSALAVWTRIFADAFSQLGWCDFRDTRSRRRAIVVLSWVFPLAWATVFLIYDAPVMMIVLGGVATSALLLLVVFAAIVFRRSENVAAIRPGRLYDTAFAISCTSIALFALFGLSRALGIL